VRLPDPRGPVRRTVARGVDAALEISVVGGFGSPGIRVRRRLQGWSELPDLSGREVVITGATSGLGRAAAVAMRRRGARLTIVGRDAARTRSAAAQISAAGGDTTDPVRVALADLAVLDDARRFANEYASSHAHLDVLVHNAGALTADYRRTPDGFEATYASQVLAPHVITAGLLPLLAASDGGRVITVSSGGMYTERLEADRMELPEEHYDGVRAYAMAKRAQVSLTQEWADRFPEPVQFHAMHPGWADTPGVQASLPTFRRLTRPILRTADEGADTVVWLAGVDPIPGPNGSFWADRAPRSTVRLPRTGAPAAERAALWDLVCAQSGVRPALAGARGAG
jgi:NAD(P)-dependent dehydrogenase (short-subunit alcohol dehydrogenase family)